jgi:DNA mismatch repair protein MutS2
MKNIIEILSSAGPGTLVLFDELGAGTDPSEGSALAMAVLSELTVKGALTVATTHINELKLFAQVQDKMQNASMEFDPDSLAPTYRLLQGVPGQSNALYIAEQLGLDQYLLEKAKSFLHRSHDQVESVIASLVEDQQRYHRDSRQAAMERNRAELILSDLEKDRELLKARKEDILQEAREEARRLVRSAKSNTDQLIKELKLMRNQSSVGAESVVEKARLELARIRREIDAGEEVDYDEQGLNLEDIKAGDQVFIPGIKQKGEVISFAGEEVLIQIGSMKVHLAPRELRKGKDGSSVKKRKEQQKASGGYSVTKDLAISSSIDLRGLNFEEAQPLVDKLLDNALWAGLNQVDLIHGKGTGKLKERVRDYLKEHPLAKSFRSGDSTEGGEGVTVVEVKS